VSSPCPFPSYVGRGLIGILLLFITTHCFAASSQLKEANRQFKNGHYDKALKLYEDGLVDTPYSSVLKYNAGAAAYQSSDFPKASRYFQEADQNATPAVKPMAFYNRGNALYKEGRTPDAIEAYKQALRLNPGDEAARYNLSVALMGQPSGQPSQKQKSNDGGGQDEKKKNDPHANEKDKESQNGQDQNAPIKPGQMSKEDAERLLEAAAAGEMKKRNQPPQKPGKGTSDEDW